MGIGRATAVLLGELGAAVAIPDRDAALGDALAGMRFRKQLRRPVGREEMLLRGKLFGRNGASRIAGEGSRSTMHPAFLASGPKKMAQYP
jgi:NAD(P)-dependent dehydrogenase (short-subunit alcohol dehydrogenase family)